MKGVWNVNVKDDGRDQHTYVLADLSPDSWDDPRMLGRPAKAKECKKLRGRADRLATWEHK